MRTKQIILRVTDEERRLIDEGASFAGMTRSEFVRYKVIGVKPGENDARYKEWRPGTEKLDEERVAEIRRLRNVEGLRLSEIANRFRVTESVVSDIARGKTWKHA